MSWFARWGFQTGQRNIWSTPSCWMPSFRASWSDWDVNSSPSLSQFLSEKSSFSDKWRKQRRNCTPTVTGIAPNLRGMRELPFCMTTRGNCWPWWLGCKWLKPRSCKSSKHWTTRSSLFPECMRRLGEARREFGRTGTNSHYYSLGTLNLTTVISGRTCRQLRATTCSRKSLTTR